MIWSSKVKAATGHKNGNVTAAKNIFVDLSLQSVGSGNKRENN
jgi:hypothetical protein